MFILGAYPAATGYSYPSYNSASGGMHATNSYPNPTASTATPPPYPPTTGSNMSLQSSTGTITEEHIHASLLSAVEDKLKKRLREVLAQSQVCSFNFGQLCSCSSLYMYI